MLVCDGLKGLPDAVNTVWDKTVVQTCVIHLLRNTFRYAARQDWDRIAKDLRPIYTAVNEAMARERFAEFAATWRSKYPAAVALWERAWSEFVPFLDYDVEIRKIIAATNSIESLNARYRRAVRARGHFPTDQAALKMPVPGHQIAGPHRPRQGTMGHPMEGSAQRVRHHLRRAHQPSNN